MGGARGETPAWLKVVVGALAVGGLFYAATRPRFGADPWGLGPIERRMLQAELGAAVLEPVDLARAPHDLDRLVEADPTRWLFTAFERCGSIDLSRFAGPWISDAPRWTDPRVEEGRIQGGSSLREELCPVHVVSDDGAQLTALAVHHEDVHDPGDAWLRWVRLTRAGDTLEVCDATVLEALGAECVRLHR